MDQMLKLRCLTTFIFSTKMKENNVPIVSAAEILLFKNMSANNIFCFFLVKELLSEVYSCR